MDNENWRDMKGRILQILKTDGAIVSGETISRALGISRVSVWKHIRKLQQLGYDIEPAAKGYRLVASPDIPYPWEFPDLDAQIHYFEEIDSTMQAAKKMAAGGCPHMTVVVAGRQKKGRGRLKRVWLSARGGLYFTMVLRPDIPVALSPRISFLASLVLADTLHRRYAIDARVKWPNDILVNGKKLCGMLAEMEAEADMVTFVNIGIGINVNHLPRPKEQPATSLKRLLKKDVSRTALLADFLKSFNDRFSGEALVNVIAEWKRYTMTLNQPVRIVTTRETTEGIAEDVDETGALLLRLADGSQKKIICGDCFQPGPPLDHAADG